MRGCVRAYGVGACKRARACERVRVRVFIYYVWKQLFNKIPNVDRHCNSLVGRMKYNCIVFVIRLRVYVFTIYLAAPIQLINNCFAS